MYYENQKNSTIKIPQFKKIKAIISRIFQIRNQGELTYKKQISTHQYQYTTGNYYLK